MIKGRLKKKINLLDIKKVYDLQTSKRSSSYFNLFNENNIEWSGIVKGCSHFHENSDRDNLHTVDRFRDQLKFANIKKFSKPDLDWLFEPIDKKYYLITSTLMVPGGSSKRKYKRWSPKIYISIAQILIKKYYPSSNRV